MLVLSRKPGEKIMIGDDIEVTVSRVDHQSNNVRLTILAPKDVKILREELYLREKGIEGKGVRP